IDAQTVTPLGGSPIDRLQHEATLTSDGQVLVSGGRRRAGTRATNAQIVDPQTGRVAPAPASSNERDLPTVSGVLPASGTTDVSLDSHFALRFTDPMAANSLTSATLSLSGPAGPLETRIIVAEQGRLAFVWPAERLAE